jgi:Family of unknown function (DUF6335)
MKKRPRPSRDRGPRALPVLPAVEDAGPKPLSSATAVAAEAMRTGALPTSPARRRNDIPSEEAMRVGDPDDSTFDNEYSGDELPGGDSPTPDQNGVDDIGRAYGLQEEDNGVLRTASEVLERRDRHRSELRPPGRR